MSEPMTPDAPDLTGFIADQRRKDGLRASAAKLLAEGSRQNVEQVHEIVIRDVDAHEDKPLVLRLIPLGDVIGVAITPADRLAEDQDILYISARALASSLAALGYRLPAIHVCDAKG